MAVEFVIAGPALVVLLLLVSAGGQWLDLTGDVSAAARDSVRAASFARQYNDLNFKVARREHVYAGLAPAPAPAIARLHSARFESADGVPIVSIAQGEPCVVQMEVLFEAEAHNPVFAVALRNEFGVTAFAAHSELGYGDSGHFRAGQLATIRLRFDNWLAPARYTLIASVTADGPSPEIYDLRDDLGSLIVYASDTAGGIVDLPHTFEVERT